MLQRIATGDELSEVIRESGDGIKPVAGTQEALTSGSQCSSYHPTSRAAHTLSLVCKCWYYIATPLVFRHLYVNNTFDWFRLALRLAEPACSVKSTSKSVSVTTPCKMTAGHYVKWVDVMTEDLDETKQLALCHVLCQLFDLRGLVVCTVPSERGLAPRTKFTSKSAFIKLLTSSLKDTCTSIQYASFTMSLLSSAVPSFFSTLATFINVQVLVLQLDTKATDGQCVFHPYARTAEFKLLRVLYYKNLLDANYPHLTHISRRGYLR